MAIRVAIAGLGGLGRNAVQSLPQWGPYEIVGGTDVSAAARDLAEQQTGIRTWDTLPQLLAEARPDLVYVATSSFAHVEPVVTALEAGCAVVVEKPMAANLAEADVMVAAARAGGKLLLVGHNRRGDGDFLTLQSAVREGKLGEILMLHSRLLANATEPQPNPDDWRQDASRAGGSLMDWGPHLLDQVLALIPSPPVRVLGRVETLRWRPELADNHFHALIWFANGATAEVEYNNVAALELPRYWAMGTEACAVKHGMRGCVGVPAAFHTELLVRDYASGKLEIVPDQRPDYGVFWRNLVEVLEGTAEPLVPLEHAYRVMQVIEAVRRSAQAGQVVGL